MAGPPRVVLVLLMACLLTIPLVVASPPTIRSMTTYTLDEFQSIADSLLAIPQVHDALPDGSLLRFKVLNAENADEEMIVEGHVASGSAQMALVHASSGDAGLEITAFPTVWGALVNACDRATTAKLAIRNSYVGIDGAASARAAANGIRTGRFDSQLAASPPTNGQAFACSGENPVIHDELLHNQFWVDNNQPAFDRHILTANVSGRIYVIDDLGAIEARLPDAWMVTAVHTAFGTTASMTGAIGSGVMSAGMVTGSYPIPAACNNGDLSNLYQSLKWYVIATCVQDRSTGGH